MVSSIVSGGERRIKLQSSSSSSVVVVFSEDRVDLGSISRMFGIVPATLKLNGHFISRGFDLVASSVTWNSLLTFFSARSLSTDPILVHGNLISNKRSHESQAIESGSHSITEHDVIGVKRQLKDINFIKNKRGPRAGSVSICTISVKYSIPDFKRKQTLEDLHHFKKLKIDETSMAKSLEGAGSETFSDFRRRGNNLLSTGSGTQFACKYMSNGLKRPREDVVVSTTSCKKIK